MQSLKKIGIKLNEGFRSQSTNVHVHTFIESEPRSENDKVYKVEKVSKINAKIISKAHTHLQTMEKTRAKFQKDRYKII